MTTNRGDEQGSPPHTHLMRRFTLLTTALATLAAGPAKAHEWVSYFETRRSDLSEGGFVIAREVAHYCRANRCLEITIDAHTDASEAARPGFREDLDRGREMMLELVRQGMAPGRINIRRHGASRLARPLGSRPDEPLNRRVTINVDTMPPQDLAPPARLDHSTMPRIFFPYGGADVPTEWRFTLQLLAAQWRPGCWITLRGGADASGSAEANQRLSERRAESVARLLVQYGVGWSDLRLSGSGERMLSRPTRNGVAEPLNRVVAADMRCGQAEPGPGKHS